MFLYGDSYVMAFHLSRIFIARSLLNFLPEVAPSEAVEYVIPLMNGLAMDDGELTALVSCDR